MPDDKQRRGLLDYDDLVDKTLGLLTRTDAAWVHYKLDFGIDHVLVDEAQDTSSKQWDIVRRLDRRIHRRRRGPQRQAHDFRGWRRETVDLFISERRAKGIRGYAPLFQAAHEGSGQKFVTGGFEHSFRSGESVLARGRRSVQARKYCAERQLG